MTKGFQTVLAASERERRDLFLTAANRLGTAEQNIEKDFWVCWTLDALFNELEAGGPPNKDGWVPQLGNQESDYRG